MSAFFYAFCIVNSTRCTSEALLLYNVKMWVGLYLALGRKKIILCLTGFPLGIGKKKCLYIFVLLYIVFYYGY